MYILDRSGGSHFTPLTANACHLQKPDTPISPKSLDIAAYTIRERRPVGGRTRIRQYAGPRQTPPSHTGTPKGGIVIFET